jgi:hypothetical protein
VIEVPNLKWGKDDHKDAMLGRALTYLVLYSTLGMMVCSATPVKSPPACPLLTCSLASFALAAPLVMGRQTLVVRR